MNPLESHSLLRGAPVAVHHEGTKDTKATKGQPIVSSRASCPRVFVVNGLRSQGSRATHPSVSASRCFANRRGSNGCRSSTALADAEKANGKVELAPKRRHRPAPGAAVELGDHDSRRTHRVGEQLALLYRVLAHGTVQHQQCFVRRARQPAGAHPRHLAQLIHQAFLGVEPACRVHDNRIQTARDRPRRWH